MKSALSRLRRLTVASPIRQPTTRRRCQPAWGRFQSCPSLDTVIQASSPSWQAIAAAASIVVTVGLSTYGSYVNSASSDPEPQAIETSKPPKMASPCNPIELSKDAHDPVVTRGTISSRRATLSIPDSQEISKILRENEESYVVSRGNGVTRYDTCQIASNTPIEDAHSEQMLRVQGGDWMFWGIYDGHRGWPTSAKLKQSLIGYVFEGLQGSLQYTAEGSIPGAIDSSIAKSFIKLDNEIVYNSVAQVIKAGSKSLAAHVLSPALSGSCALLGFYDSRTNIFRTACTGDSRAILGRKSESGSWSAIPLSIDQTGGNPDEAARIRAEHPGEDTAVARGRILGHLEPSRAFGDGIYKWTVETQLKLHQSYFARSPHKNTISPPYVTAEPVITSMTIEPKNEDFVVMASDSLWEMLTNEEVVALVAKWKLDQQKQKPTNNASAVQRALSWLWPFSSTSRLSIDQTAGPVNTWRIADRPGQWELERKPEQYICKDDNVATHIARNAFGGKKEDLVAGLLMLPTPNSRRYRDDLTITVIFFGENEKLGGNDE